MSVDRHQQNSDGPTTTRRDSKAKKIKKPRAKLGKVPRLRNRVERIEARITKLEGRLKVSQERLAATKVKLQKAEKAAANG